MKTFGFLALIAAATLAASPAAAQSTANSSLTVASSIPLTAYIDLDKASINFNTVLTSDLRAGGYAAAPIPVSSSFGGNGALNLAYNWQGSTITGAGGNTINPNNVEVSINGGPFTAMTVSDPAWQTFAKGNYTQSYTFRLKVSMQTPPDTYTGQINFAVTAS